MKWFCYHNKRHDGRREDVQKTFSHPFLTTNAHGDIGGE
jgi:hypothetical protein